MPHSCKSIIRKLHYKGYITDKECEKLLRNFRQLIRCKDCKWFGDIGCAIEVVDDSDRPTENDFCSFAERRTK